jgi:integrase
MTLKELANRFLAAQRANWRNPETTLKCYTDWLGRFLADHPGVRVVEFSVERFVSWKLSLKERGYSAESINHYLGAVRAMFRFAEDTELVERAPRLARVRNESKGLPREKPLYVPLELRKLLDGADCQLRAMIMLALNCGFGPKDIHDLTWDHIEGDRVTLPRSKTGVSQTFILWPETSKLLGEVRRYHEQRLAQKRKPESSAPPSQHIFMTLFGQTWSRDAIAEQFRKLCKKTGVPCHKFYRLRHCASTAMSLVASPHVQRKFMRHSQIQPQGERPAHPSFHRRCAAILYLPYLRQSHPSWQFSEQLAGRVVQRRFIRVYRSLESHCRRMVSMEQGDHQAVTCASRFVIRATGHGIPGTRAKHVYHAAGARRKMPGAGFARSRKAVVAERNERRRKKGRRHARPPILSFLSSFFVSFGYRLSFFLRPLRHDKACQGNRVLCLYGPARRRPRLWDGV